MIDLTALIVTYNSADHIAACAEAAAKHCTEVLVVDNASTDDTLQCVPAGARVIANPKNLGFAGGVNLGMREARHDAVLLLNPDAILLDDPAPLAAANAAIAAGLLVDAAGQPQSGFSVRRFPTPAALAFEALGWNRLCPGNPVNRHWRALDLDLTHAQPVEQPAGAFLLIHRPAWRAVGGLDEAFFPVWFEDVDFLKRIHAYGGIIQLLPNVRAHHTGGHSVNRLTGSLKREYWYGSLFRYAGKHFSPAGRRSVAVAVAAGAVGRWLAGLVTGNRSGYARVLRLALRNLS